MVTTGAKKTLKEFYDDLRLAHGSGKISRATTLAEDPFVLKVAQLLLSYGVEIGASDIHMEPMAANTRIRYRVDGLLHDMLRVPPEVGELLIRSIKVRVSMATDTLGRSKPQDGRIDFESNGRKLDLRVSSFPTLFGDVLAIRMLDRAAPRIGLEQLGFPHDEIKQFERLMRRPNGLILVTGPTNSGKTTTLYATLEKIRSPHIKIVTLEDPVEYQMDDVDQAQINSSVGVTFASGLRAILRQDANVILVGEIRDKETADIAVRAALTGHMVLSTLHTRHSCGAITRLLDMGIEPHLIVASLTGVVAQRLVRRPCAKCQAPDAMALKTFARLWKQETGVVPPESEATHLVKGVGCSACISTGYQGRSGLFELLVLNDELKQIILDRSSSQLYKTAVSLGMRSMLLDGLDKARQGQTTVEEVLRVTGEIEEG